MGETRSARILVIDDEPALARLIVRMLQRQGWVIDAVESSEEALESLADTRYDVLIVDKNLPGMDGIELIRTVRRTDKAVGVIVVTGYATEESAMDAVEVGVDGYIEKPFRIQEMTTMVELALANGIRRAGIGHNLTHAKQLARSAQSAASAEQKTRILATLSEADADWLTGLDANLTVVSSHAEAMEHLSRAEVDLLILDASLPGFMSTAEDVHVNFPQTGCLVIGPTPDFPVLRKLINIQVIAIIPPDDPSIVERITTLVTGRAPGPRRPRG